MKIIISPTKNMRLCDDDLGIKSEPKLIKKTEKILMCLKEKSFSELKQIWGCNEKIAKENAEKIHIMNLNSGYTHAILAYDGIAFKYMSPSVFTNKEFDYIQKNLRILSGFYGALKPMDNILPYRLEMQAKIEVDGFRNLYDFWGKDIYNCVRDSSGIFINLASKEYSQCIEKYLTSNDQFINCIFCENINGKQIQKGTFAKMARGEMVRYLAENNIENPNEMQKFNRLGYVFSESLSNKNEYVFLKQ